MPFEGAMVAFAARALSPAEFFSLPLRHPVAKNIACTADCHPLL